MKLKQYLTERRSKTIEQDEAIAFIKKNCMKTANSYARGNVQIFRGLELGYSGKPNYMQVHGMASSERRSRNTSNHYTLLMDNLPSWKSYPLRSHSIICSTSIEKVEGYGDAYVVYPVDSAKIAFCDDRDIFDSFKFMKGKTMRAFNSALSKLIAHMTTFGTSVKFIKDEDDDWGSLKRAFEKFDTAYKEVDDGDPQFGISRAIGHIMDGKKIMDTYDPNKGMMDNMNKLMSPKSNKFQILKAGSKYPNLRECWIADKCILVRAEENGSLLNRLFLDIK